MKAVIHPSIKAIQVEGNSRTKNDLCLVSGKNNLSFYSSCLWTIDTAVILDLELYPRKVVRIKFLKFKYSLVVVYDPCFTKIG